jgi:hypothetical protein
MASHRLVLGDPFPAGKVGNSVSTTASWDGQTLTVSWKDRWEKRVPARRGDRVAIEPGGLLYGGGEYGPPVDPVRVTIQTPPRDPVARVAWERRFYAAKRRPSLEQLRRDAAAEERYDRPRGYLVPAATVYVSEAGHCAVAYRDAMDGQVGTPWGWWADAAATPEEMAGLLGVALTLQPGQRSVGPFVVRYPAREEVAPCSGS